MESTTAPVPGLPGMFSKEINDQPSPPPAYTPSRRFDISSSLASRASPQRQSVLVDRLSLASLVTSANQPATDAGEANYSDDSLISCLSLRINTSVKISNSNNYVCIKETPAEHANAIARAVVHAIQENSSGQCGIPMIDEDGRPRPVRVEVDAGLEVHGEGNVVGSETFVQNVLYQREQNRVVRRFVDDEILPSSPAKRRRSE